MINITLKKSNIALTISLIAFLQSGLAQAATTGIPSLDFLEFNDSPENTYAEGAGGVVVKQNGFITAPTVTASAGDSITFDSGVINSNLTNAVSAWGFLVEDQLQTVTNAAGQTFTVELVSDWVHLKFSPSAQANVSGEFISLSNGLPTLATLPTTGIYNIQGKLYIDPTVYPNQALEIPGQLVKLNFISERNQQLPELNVSVLSSVPEADEWLMMILGLPLLAWSKNRKQSTLCRG